MIDDDVKAELKTLDTRLSRVEQVLPTLATKDDLTATRRELEARFETVATKQDLERFATKQDLERFATKQDLERFATKQDLERFATKQDLERFATKQDLERFATNQDLETRVETLATKEELAETRREVREQAELTRRHFDLIAESLRDEIRIALEGNIGVTSRVETLERQHGRLERRVTLLEAHRSRRRK